jgi:hypothetical protein
MLQSITSLPTRTAPTGSEGAIQPWHDNALIRFFLYRLRLPPHVVALLVGGVYWFIPLAFAAWDGALMRAASAQSVVGFLKSLGMPSAVVAVANGIAAHQKFQGESSLPYLEDPTHFLFAIVLSLGALVATLTLKDFDRTVVNLKRNRIPQAKIRVVEHIYQSYRHEAFQTKYIVACAVFGAAACALFLYLHFSPNYAFWWGNREHGVAGLVFVPIVGAMVFTLLWGSILLLCGSLMLARIM